MFTLSPDANEFATTPEFLSLDGKINTEKLTVIKPDTGIVELSEYSNNVNGFYIPMQSGDSAVFKSVDNSIIFRLTNENDRYTLEKISGVELSSSKEPPLSSKVDINGFTFGFKNGIYNARDEIAQKYNCIATSQWAMAYLTKSGKVITWGVSANGGYSHTEPSISHSGIAPHTSYDIMEPNEELLSDVVDIVGNLWGFVALKSDGTVITWGAQYAVYSESSTGVQAYPYYIKTKKNARAIFTNEVGAVAAILKDDTAICWGRNYGRSKEYLFGDWTNMKTIIPCYYGFMGLKNNGDLVTWGHDEIGLFHPTYGVYGTRWKNANNFTSHQTKLTNIVECYSNRYMQLALNSNGNLIGWGNGTMPSSLKSILNTHTFVNVMSSHWCFAALDINGAVFAFGKNNVFTDTGGQWRDVSGDVGQGVIRIAASTYDFMCLRDDNVAVGIRGSDYNYTGIDFSNNEIDTNSSRQINYPPSQYIIGRYKLKDIKDIFPQKIVLLLSLLIIKLFVGVGVEITIYHL